MKPPRDDQYAGPRDLLGRDPGDDPSDDSADGSTADLPDDPADADARETPPPEPPPAFVATDPGGEAGARREDQPTMQIPLEELSQPRKDPSQDREEAPAAPDPAPSAGDEPTRRLDLAAASGPLEPTTPAAQAGPSTQAEQPPDAAPDAGDTPRDTRLRTALLGAAALLVIVAAFGFGRLLADQAAHSDGDAEAQVAGTSGQGDPAYRGPVAAVPVSDAVATCQSQASVDSGGNRVSYEPAMAYDSNLRTAWRCDGSGVGQRLTITLPGETVVAKVGLVPGYAKTDPVSGADRYAENNRITKVRWRFGNGTSYVQRMSGNLADRRMRTKRLPETSASKVVLEILASQPGPRNTVAISELRVASPAG